MKRALVETSAAPAAASVKPASLALPSVPVLMCWLAAASLMPLNTRGSGDSHRIIPHGWRERAASSVSGEADKGVDLDAFLAKPVAAAEIGQIDDECRGDEVAARLADKLDRRIGGAAGGNQIVDEKHAVALADRIGVNLDRVDAVFERIFLPDDARGELALLADRHEAAAEHMSYGAAEDEAARLDAGDKIDIALEKRPGELIDRRAKGMQIGKKRGDVAEQDAGLRIVGNGSD